MASATINCLVFFTILTTAAANCAKPKVTHLHFYFHEIPDGPNKTVIAVSTPPGGSFESFGYVGLFDDLLKEGAEPSSRLIGRAQGIVTKPTIDSAGSILTTFEFVFTDGEYAGSSIAIFGRALTGEVFERAIIGGTGKFRMARGYTLSKVVDNTPPGVGVLEYDAYVIQSEDYDLLYSI